MARKAVTIAVLAEHLGMAKGTVSRALNDYSDISKATKDKLARAAIEMGYTPNRTAQNLARGVQAPKLHLVRPTPKLAAIRGFYVDGLGLDVLFEGTHDSDDEGFVVGAPQCLYGIEFKKSSRLSNEWTQREVFALNFCYADFHKWEEAVIRMKTAAFVQVACPEPSPVMSSHTFEDPDGYHISVQHTARE
ncbi:MAG: LacI family DNA-binding transcriptional regulator [Litoreibacter sp.]|nr:LacI family DNA-binding transcriptional regulator [Litoreibacter sp.]MCY4336970.1 LacI family DNA-binding transcriptional regulator [Litoreibacter sp.]